MGPRRLTESTLSSQTSLSRTSLSSLLLAYSVIPSNLPSLGDGQNRTLIVPGHSFRPFVTVERLTLIQGYPSRK